MNHRYLVSLGSNIDPHQNVARALLALMNLSPRLDISRIIETEPVGMIETGQFLNLSLCLYSTLDSASLKVHFNEIETSLGRDRKDVLSKVKSRPADLDLLFHLCPNQESIAPHQLPTESYIRPALLELLHYLGIDFQEAVPDLPDGVPMLVGPVQIGRQPATLYRPSEKQPIKLVPADQLLGSGEEAR